MHTSSQSAQPELVSLVDDNDRVIDSADKRTVYANGLLHRVSHVFIFNHSGHLLLQQRSALTEFCSFHWSSSAQGHVRRSETYVDAARRESKEELGADITPFYTGSHRYNSHDIHKCIGICTAHYSGVLYLNSEKVATVRFIKIRHIREFLRRKLVHPELTFLLSSRINLESLFETSVRVNNIIREH